jgi:diacylglycerol kinase (ATP)
MKKLFSISRLIKSFGYSFKGLLHVVATETNAQIHLLALLVTTFTGFYFDISHTEWLIQTLIISAVISAEFFNTAIEKIIDLLHPEENHKAGLIKDVASAAVLVLAIGALVIAYMIYWDKIKLLM